MNEQGEQQIFVVRTNHEEGAEVAAAFPTLEAVLAEITAAFEDDGVQLVSVERVSFLQDGQPQPKMPRVSLVD